mgnify:CR=1 FL=1
MRRKTCGTDSRDEGIARNDLSVILFNYLVDKAEKVAAELGNNKYELERSEVKLWLSTSDGTETGTDNEEQPLLEIHKLKEFDLSLRKAIKAVRTEDGELENLFTILEEDATRELNSDGSIKNIITGTLEYPNTTATYNHRKDPVVVKEGQIVEYVISIYNEGKADGYATKIVDQLPPISELRLKDNNDIVSLRGNTYSVNFDINNKVDIGYFGQMNINRLNLNNTIEEELWEIDKTLPRNKILNIAGTMMFTGDDYKKRLSVLSGGEKSRVLLGKIILKPCNLLLLDEPTNHLDMESCISLMEAINNFAGASVTITHNEDFLNNVANKLIVFDDDKTFVFEGGYQDFLREIGWSNEEEIKEVKVKSEKVINTVENNKNNKKIDKNFLKKKEKLENEIFKLELKMEEMILGGNYNVADLQKKIDVKTAELEEMVK